MGEEKTRELELNQVNEKIIKDTIDEAVISLEERGYNAINQITGYLISGDLGYISSYNETRKKISKLDRSLVLEVILRKYVGKWNI